MSHALGRYVLITSEPPGGPPGRALLYNPQPRTPPRSVHVCDVCPLTEVTEDDIASCRGRSVLPRAHSHRGPEGQAALLLCPAADPGAAPASCRSRGSCCSAHRHSQQRQPGQRRSASEEGASTSAACSAGQARHTGEDACGINTCSVKCPAHAGGPNRSHDATVELCSLQ